jgi:hypothetical protein
MSSQTNSMRVLYPRYSTTLFLSRTATEEPGSAKLNVAFETDLELDFEVSLMLTNGCHFAPVILPQYRLS